MNILHIGRIVSQHGFNGKFKVDFWILNAFNLFEFICDENGEKIKIKYINMIKDLYLCYIEDFNFISNKDLFIDKVVIKDENPAFFEINSIGMDVFDLDESYLGIVYSVENFGAEDLIVVKKDDNYHYYSRNSVQNFDIKNNKLIVKKVEF